MLQWLAGGPPVQIIEIDQVWNEVKRIIEDAEDELVLVSPYNDYSVPLKEAVAEAAGTVHIVAVCREEQEKQESKHFEWLRSIGAEVHLVSRLHAKIYYNESEAIVTSMNLLKTSATDSREIGFAIHDAGLRDQIREYVQSDLIAHSKPFAPAHRTAKPKPRAARPAKARAKQVPASGSCIRCGDMGIAYSPDEPLCPKCFRSWSRFKDPDYPEKHCHRCGKEHDTSMAKPLCRRCWRADVRA